MRCGWIVIAIGLLLCAAARAEEFSDPHEDGEPAWRLESASRKDIRVTTQQRQSSLVRKGRSAERIDLYSPSDGATVSLEYTIPPGQTIEDLKGFLSVHSNRLGGSLCFRAVLPNEIDPRTGETLTLLIRGTTYRNEGEWQELVCHAGERPIAAALALLRQLLNRPQLDTSDMYVDRLVYRTELRAGLNSFWFDDLQIQGIISPRAGVRAAPGIARVAAEQEREFPMSMRLNQLARNGQPFFPIIVPDHGETPGLFTATRFNTVWIPDARDALRIRELDAEGLALMATPDRPRGDDGELLDPRRAALAPFSDATRPILFWYLGTNVPSASRDELSAWRVQVAAADRRFGRPILADISGNERSYSRDLSMTACSRPVINTSWSYHEYRDWLAAKRQMCYPGCFFWTWIDVDSGIRSPSLLSGSTGGDHLLEPEQLRLQVYAALAAGCRGLGHWTRLPLDADQPGRRETRLMLAQLNRELELLAPILATGTLSERTLPFQIDGQSQTVATRTNDRNLRTATNGASANRLLPQSMRQANPAPRLEDERLEAAVIMSGTSVLLLPMWYQDHAQYVPGAMRSRDATIVVPGVSESASAWLLTSQGVQNLVARRDTGGMRIRIPDFDLTAAVVITSDFNLVRRWQAESQRMSHDDAADQISLAHAKLERVRDVESELTRLGIVRADSTTVLTHAQVAVNDAESAFRRGNDLAAVESARAALRSLRTLQRMRWEDAARSVERIEMSPYLYSYQTLPRHWELLQRVGRPGVAEGRALLTSGSFENIQALLDEGWQHQQFPTHGVVAAAELYPAIPPGQPGEYALRLASVPQSGTVPPLLFEAAPVRYSTPPLPVREGEILRITGWMRVRFPAENRLDRAAILDNFSGETACLRLAANHDWERFELLRVAERPGAFQLTFALEGLGEFQIDDLQIVSLSPSESPMPEPGPILPGEPSLRDRARDLFNRLPGVSRPSRPGE